MRVINLGEQDSVINTYMSELRDVNVQKDRMRFRHNIKRIGHAMAYEISRILDYETKEVMTPLAPCNMNLIADEIVVSTVFRAGLPFHQAFLEVFDKADNAFVSAFRYYKDKDCTDIGVRVDYMATPALDGKTLLMVDPMLATGDSMALAYEALKSKGTPKRLILASVIASEPGVENMRRIFPSDDVVLVCAAIDPILNSHKYIVPGLGDAGDLMFGEKM